MKWVTRSGVKVDRVACPWLIRRFVDPQAEFLFVSEDQLLETARREGAIPFDATRLPEVKLNHRGDRCTFDAILEDYKLTDPALHRLARIVRGADVKGQEHLSPEALGLRAIALEDNYGLYHVIHGSRRQFAGANFKVTSGEWHEIKVECVGNKFICYYDGAKKIEATDDTFKDAGKVGLWTKADSLTYFDDLKVAAK